MKNSNRKHAIISRIGRLGPPIRTMLRNGSTRPAEKLLNQHPARLRLGKTRDQSSDTIGVAAPGRFLVEAITSELRDKAALKRETP